MKRQLKEFDKYDYYFRTVQSPWFDCSLASKIYRQLSKGEPRVLREDFCGAFAICCEWVRRNKLNKAYGVDLDPEPLAYGREHYLSELKADQKKRIQLFQDSVLTAKLPLADITMAMNFSFYIFKSRMLLRQYFARVRKGLKSNGIFLLDCFGGMACGDANLERTKFRSYEYFWEQDGFNPITHEAKFHIHFKRKGEKKRNKVFSYDWRLWTIPEIRETLIEAGFSKTHVYWEGVTKRGHGDGVYRKSEVGEECESFVAYIAAER